MGNPANKDEFPFYRRICKLRKENIMNHEITKNNWAMVIGELVSDFHYSHRICGERFYTTEVSVNRLSNVADIIPLMVSERLISEQFCIGKYVRAEGAFRSCNRHEGTRNRLILHVFVQKLELLDKQWREESNQIILDGYICKPTVYRETPLGKEITDMLLAVNRAYRGADYIPCICWGRNARYASGFEVGSHIKCHGRIQSREYVKKIPGTEFKTAIEQRVAYEVSVSRIDAVEKSITHPERRMGQKEPDKR